MRRIIILTILLCSVLTINAQRFFNLTSDEVRVDSVLPLFGYSVPLSGSYHDSIYSASILYPEFIDMTSTDIANYHRLSADSLPALPEVQVALAQSRKQGQLDVTFCPLVYRDGKYQILVSFMLRVDSKAKSRSVRRAQAAAATTAADRYAAHSVLASGNWAKIRVPASGIYQLTDALIRKAGFSDFTKVKVYGYGGALQNESLNPDDLVKYDDLKEVPLCIEGGKRLFYAQGPVSWSSNTAARRTRNPYSDYGYYFITQSDAEPTTVDSATFVSAHYPSADDYHTLYEVDGFSWYPGGRNLFDTEATSVGQTRRIVLNNVSTSKTGQLSVNVSAGTNSAVDVYLNDSLLGTQNIRLGSYDKGSERAASYKVYGLHATDTVKIVPTSGGPVRLDYVSMAWSNAKPAPNIATGTFAEPEYVYNITNQDLHGDGQYDMVIIIPTSQKVLTQAQRLKTFHENHDGMRVRIVPADELYNEFSSGTPDANAYRRYLKMLYDRATTDSDAPRYLLLMGDCVWDNRMLTTNTRNLSPDDYLLCFESENSFNEVTCYVDDGFFCLLDDGEGTNPQRSDKLDMAVGRFPVTTEAEAKIMVDKAIAYANNSNAGSWENELMFLGDDGNNNLHMHDINDAAEAVSQQHPGYVIKKVMWDAYTRQSTSTGYRYPEATAVIKKQQQNGALIMDYGGHGIEYQISHEAVLTLNDFEGFTNENLPLWITASCDIMPFDGTAATIGETAVLKEGGGAIAFYGTTRTVYASYNKVLNMAFLKRVLSYDDNGKPITIGEAQRLAKNDMLTDRNGDRTTNKLQYSLLGDPALALNLPTLTAVIDSIDGTSLSSAASLPQLKAGATVRVRGHVKDAPAFNGTMTLTVRDSRELIVCKQQESTADTAFTYYDHTKTLYTGTDSVRAGQFTMTFTVPKDINYSNQTGLINLFAVSSDRKQVANGYCDQFTVGGSAINSADTIGPDIYCYLNTPEFVDGGKVNITPYFVAQISDSSGINTSGNSIGHDLQLVIDGKASLTYNLNDNFTYDFGSYTSGSTFYSIPELEPGHHYLQFRAWDILNNSTTKTLHFTVVKGLSPSIYSVSTTDNPASTTTTFIVSHDHLGSDVKVRLEVFDTSGRILWRHEENASGTSAYTYTWDLCSDTGAKLQTGVYLYRVSMSCDGSVYTDKTKKLIVINNN